MVGGLAGLAGYPACAPTPLSRVRREANLVSTSFSSHPLPIRWSSLRLRVRLPVCNLPKPPPGPCCATPPGPCGALLRSRSARAARGSCPSLAAATRGTGGPSCGAAASIPLAPASLKKKLACLSSPRTSPDVHPATPSPRPTPPDVPSPSFPPATLHIRCSSPHLPLCLPPCDLRPLPCSMRYYCSQRVRRGPLFPLSACCSRFLSLVGCRHTRTGSSRRRLRGFASSAGTKYVCAR